MKPRAQLLYVMAVFIVAAGCSHAPAAKVATLHPSSEQVAACPSRLHGAPEDVRDRTYQLTDAVWLDGAPIAINEDFDFAMALMGDATGAGIAAGQRKRANQTKAEQLSAVALGPATLARVEALRVCGIRAYGLLWGRADSVVLKVVVEQPSDGETIEARRVLDTTTLAIAGDEGWAAPTALDRALAAGLDRIRQP